MAAGTSSGRRGWSGGPNNRPAPKEEPGCFGLIAFVIIGAAGLASLVGQALVQWGS